MRHLIFAIFKAVPRIIASDLLWLRKHAKHQDKIPLDVRYQKLRNLVIKILDALKIDMTVVGKENLPKEAFFLASNHLAALDPLCYISVIEQASSVVAKVELSKVPIVKRALTSVDGLFLDRSDLKQSLRVMLKVEDNFKTKKDKNWLIFPEGTRNKDIKADVAEFHHGTFRAASRSQVPIVPAAIYGSFRLVSTKVNLKRYPIYIEFGEPLYYEDYKDMSTEEIAKIIHDRVSKMLSYNARRHDQLEMMKLKK